MTMPYYCQQRQTKTNSSEGRILNYLGECGVLEPLLEDGGVQCDPNYRIKMPDESRVVYGTDAARAICRQLSRLGIQSCNIRKVIRGNVGEIALTKHGKKQLLGIMDGCEQAGSGVFGCRRA